MRRAFLSAIILILAAVSFSWSGIIDDAFVELEAFEAAKTSAEHGDATAQALLGDKYYFGEGVPIDYVEASKWYRKAAEQGEVHSQAALGCMYDVGNGVPQDYIEAVKWYKKAAEQGDGLAQNNLGVKYAQGYGVPKDYILAHMWFNLAGASGYKDAPKNRDITASLMTPSQIAEAQKQAREWKPKTDRAR